MACPTCDHTLGLLTSHEDMRFFSCDRCGTVVVKITNRPDRVYVPKLVQRCRTFQSAVLPDGMGSTGELASRWQHLGIRESINVPADRPE